MKFESIALQGFTFSAAFGEDDLWDVALRYAGEFNGIKIALGAGYSQWHRLDHERVQLLRHRRRGTDC